MTDDILIFEGKDITIREDCRDWKCFIDLGAKDGTKKKHLFKTQLKFLYYVFTKSSPFHDRYTPSERTTMFFDQIEPDFNKSRLISFELKQCVPYIRRHSMLRSEIQLEKILEDFDRLFTHLSSIPWEREVKEIIKTGKKVIEKTYMQSNKDEKLKAIKSSKDLISLQKEVEKILRDERKVQAAGGKKKRLYEDPESMDFI